MAEQRLRFLVGGIVQGVGFRPFVFNLAESEGLTGLVSNTSAGVVIEVQGPLAGLDSFRRRLRREAPALSRIVSVTEETMTLRSGDLGFRIEASRNTPGTNTLIPADMATCASCLADIRDPENRRYGYPFTNCTNCGPRWTIIDRIPYDRPFTSMADFAMCEDCRREYADPRDRRFHAQPNACPACGPRLWLEKDGQPLDEEHPLTTAARRLADGSILAIKGLGGFHLAVNASSQEAVTRLRLRKNREAKPLAVMTATLDSARLIARVEEPEAVALTSARAPIVLLEKQTSAPGALAPAVADHHGRLGVMLPYTPLHHLLFDRLAKHGIDTLVMTSGNLSDEPICLDNQQARDRLGGIADALLLHDRGIIRRADDSVIQILDDGEPLVFRRSRGMAPVPVFVRDQGIDVLAVGPELKNTICLLKSDRAFLSPHIGNLENLSTYGFFTETIATLQGALECRPQIVAHDKHPGYFSTRWARENALRRIAVQHHHAHLVAVMAEHHLVAPTLGLIMDGTGYGDDGTIWGGEILVGNAEKFTRLGHLEPVPLPGGDAAIKAPWRTAVSYLRHTFGPDFPAGALPSSWAGKPVALILQMLAKNLNSPPTSSCGRLFDAVAALTGSWSEIHYDAQAAMELMALTTRSQVREARPFSRALTANESLLLPVGPIIEGVVAMLDAGAGPAQVSARFHRTLIDLLAAAADQARRQTGIREVVLGGGVFQNEILLQGLMESLAERGLSPFRPLQVPANDGAVALGQAVIARAACA